MRRREFLAALGGAATWPHAARAQQQRRPARIGVLHPFAPPHPWTAGLRRGLHDLGYVEGKTIAIDERGSDGRDELLEGLARTLIDSKVDALVIMTGPALLAARSQTSTVPIVMAVSSDGVGTVGVASLVRPGSNVTGLTLMSPDLAGLRLSLLKDAVPAARRIAVLYNPAERVTADELRQTEMAAGKLGVALQPVETHSGDTLDQAFANAVSGGADAFITFSHRFSLSHRSRIASLAVQHRLPAMYGWREFAEAGGLMVYGPNVADSLHRAASFVDRILKGGNPAEMSIEQPTKFELIINLKTAKALGLEIPAALLVRADEVIE
jgi:putative tryptophan/tyrosine transport system substrate-binding protein